MKFMLFFVSIWALGCLANSARVRADVTIAPGGSVVVSPSDQPTQVSCTGGAGYSLVDKYCACSYNVDQQAYDLTRVMTYSDTSVHRDLINQGLTATYCMDQVNTSRVCSN